ncbi:MAG: hypothetical protein IDH49_05795 [Gammaproteobacteria bacterium]|nr:hypothetical protein [Gammaproteobacteria bacterium]
MTEVDLEQLTLAWFQDTGLEYRHGPDIAPDGDGFELGKMLGAMKAEKQ